MTGNRKRLSRWIVVASCLAIAGALPAGAQAGSVPVNDSFASARVINPASLPYSDSVGASGAGSEPNEPSTPCNAPNNGSMWWRFTPTANGVYRADTIGSSFNSLLDVYRGTTLTGLSSVECNDDIDANNPDLLVSRIAFKATAGQSYYLRVAASGSFGQTATMHLSKVTPPANDSFAKATTIRSLPFDANAWNINATSQPTEPRPGACNHERATRWYKYTPPVDQVIWANTFLATDFDTVLAVYKGSTIGTATLIACNDDQWASGEMTDSSGVTFKALAGVTYRFQVGGYDGESGDVGELPFHVRTVTPASNDDLANAKVFSGLPYTAPFNLRRATLQATEPCGFAAIVNTQWWKFTAASTGEVHAVPDHSVTARVGVYEVIGAGFAGLDLIACGTGGVGFTPESGKTYAIQISGDNGVADSDTWTIDFGPLF